MTRTRPAWTQDSLLPNGYSKITVEVLAHLDGPKGIAEVWLRLYDTATGEWIRCESLEWVDIATLAPAIERATAEGLRDAEERLQPF